MKDVNEVIGGKVYLTSTPLTIEVEERLKKQGFWGVGIFDPETDKVYYKNVAENKPINECKFVVGLNRFKDGVVNLLRNRGVDVYAQ